MLEVDFKEIEDFETLDDRISCIDCIFVNIIGVCETFIEFIPDTEPPQNDELLAWKWIVKPSDAINILPLITHKDFKVLIEAYLENDLQKFWAYIT